MVEVLFRQIGKIDVQNICYETRLNKILVKLVLHLFKRCMQTRNNLFNELRHYYYSGEVYPSKVWTKLYMYQLSW